MLDKQTGAPAVPVTITINGTTYTLKYSTLAEYVVSDLNLDVRSFIASIRDKNAALLSDTLKIFSAMIAHNFVALQQPVPKPEHWAMALDDDPEKIKELVGKVVEVLMEKTKASAAVRLQEPAPKVEQAPPQVQ